MPRLRLSLTREVGKGIAALRALVTGVRRLRGEVAEAIEGRGMISHRNLEPCWEGWDDAIAKAARIAREVTGSEQGRHLRVGRGDGGGS